MTTPQACATCALSSQRWGRAVRCVGWCSLCDRCDPAPLGRRSGAACMPLLPALLGRSSEGDAATAPQGRPSRMALLRRLSAPLGWRSGAVEAQLVRRSCAAFPASMLALSRYISPRSLQDAGDRDLQVGDAIRVVVCEQCSGGACRRSPTCLGGLSRQIPEKLLGRPPIGLGAPHECLSMTV